jgi:hypothetical protein
MQNARRRTQDAERWTLNVRRRVGDAGRGAVRLGGRGGAGLDCGGDGVDALQDLPCAFGVGHLQSVVFIERDDELEGVDGIQAEAIGAEERLIIADGGGFDLEQEVIDQQLPDTGLEFGSGVHALTLDL